MSSYLIAVYLGNSVPVIGIGILSEWVSSLETHIVFASVISLLAATALIGGVPVRQVVTRPIGWQGARLVLARVATNPGRC